MLKRACPPEEGTVMDVVKMIALGLVAILAAYAADQGHDLAFRVHGLIILCKITSKWNVADVLTKCLPHSDSWHSIQTLFFWSGDTMDCS